MRRRIFGGILAACMMSFLLLPGTAKATPLTVDGGWYVTGAEFGGVGSFFAEGPWTFTLAGSGILDVTDLFVTGDRFSVFDGISLLFSTPAVADGTILDANYTTSPDTAFASAAFSHGSALLSAGSYSIGIRIDHIPAGFIDSEVALRVSSVPEPSTLLLLGSGLVGLGLWGRRSFKARTKS